MRTPFATLVAVIAITSCSTTGTASGPERSIVSVTTTTAGASPSLDGDCAGQPDVAALIDATQGDAAQPVACYGGRPLTIEANWVGGGIADCPSAPEPAWLACSAFSLRAAGDTRKVGAPQLPVAVDAAVGALPDGGTDVAVTGHFDDPLAQTCRETASLPGESPPPAAEAVERCRNTFVITDVVPR